jgi:hypothetical protein
MYPQGPQQAQAAADWRKYVLVNGLAGEAHREAYRSLLELLNSLSPKLLNLLSPKLLSHTQSYSSSSLNQTAAAVITGARIFCQDLG